MNARTLLSSPHKATNIRRSHKFVLGLIAVVVIVIAILIGVAAINITSAKHSLDHAQIPISVMTTNKLIATVTVGGGAPEKVTLDTGSSGLVLEESAVGPHATDTSKAISLGYGNSNNSSHYRAKVIDTSVSFSTIGDGTISTSNIKAAAFPDANLGSWYRANGVVGILGINANTERANASGLYSPLAQLPGQLSDGFTLSDSSGHPTLTLGSPSHAPSDTTIQMTPLPEHINSRIHGWDPQVDLCWTAGTTRACGPTLLDTGAPHRTIASATMPNLNAAVNGHLVSGVNVSVTTPKGATVLAPILSNTTNNIVSYVTGGRFNTGISVYLNRTIGWDLLTDKIYLSR